MAKVLVYDAYANKFYKYNLSENDPMPYSYGNTMRLREFRGSSGSQTLWTTVAAMEAWNLTRRRYGKAFISGMPLSASGRAGTAPPASTTRASRLTWGRMCPAPSACASATPLWLPRPGAM